MAMAHQQHADGSGLGQETLQIAQAAQDAGLQGPFTGNRQAPGAQGVAMDERARSVEDEIRFQMVFAFGPLHVQAEGLFETHRVAGEVLAGKARAADAQNPVAQADAIIQAWMPRQGQQHLLDHFRAGKVGRFRRKPRQGRTHVGGQVHAQGGEETRASPACQGETHAFPFQHGYLQAEPGRGKGGV